MICIARWLSVFPLSKVINFVIRAKSRNPQLPDELPKSYQVMLFWAGLRGAVGVALAAGLRGEFANSLRTTVLVVVVLTVIVFGGTTARMLEILGIRTGVAGDPDSDDEFDTEQNNAYYKRHRATAIPLSAPRESNGYTRKSTGNGALDRDGNMSYRSNSFMSQGSYSEEESDSDLPPAAAPLQRPASVPASSSAPALTEPTAVGSGSALSQLLHGSTDDHARWFTAFDENVLKPVLLHQGPGEGKGDEGL